MRVEGFAVGLRLEGCAIPIHSVLRVQGKVLVQTVEYDLFIKSQLASRDWL